MADRLTPADVRDWERTTHGKLICPECGATGYFYFDARSWIHKHAEHVTCECGKVVAKKSLAHHRGHHNR